MTVGWSGLAEDSPCTTARLLLYVRRVKFWSTSRRQRGAGRVAVVSGMLLLWLGLSAVVASPQLHRLLHKDAQDLKHQCLITQIKQQWLLAGCAAVSAPGPAFTRLEAAACSDCQFVPTCDYRLSPSRAPPSFVSSLKVVG